MANEPERPIEKRLRAAAQKRREEAGGPFEMHPATRRLLQGEVARQYPRPRGEGRSFWLLLAQLWPRLAWGTAILAVLGVVVWLVIPGASHEPSLALLTRNEPVREATPAKQAPPLAPVTGAVVPAPMTQPPPPSATPVSYADRSQSGGRNIEDRSVTGQKQLAKESLREPPTNEAVDKVLPAVSAGRMDRKRTSEAEIAPSNARVAQVPAGAPNAISGQRYAFSGASTPAVNAPAAAAPPPEVALTTAPASAAAAIEAPKPKDSEAGRQMLAFKAPAEAPPANRVKAAPAPTGALGVSYAASAKAERSLGVSQRFAQVTTDQKEKLALSDNAAAARPVLASFQMEQSGSELRIVDGDGSVYSGYLQLANPARRAGGGQDRLSLATDGIRSPKDTAEEKPAALLESEQVLPQTYFFRVAGTDRSLHQQVVFTGNLLPATNANKGGQASTNVGLVNNVEVFQRGFSPLQVVPLVNTRISGKVVVGDAQSVEINAEPMKQ